jgi:hypothetical protein
MNLAKQVYINPRAVSGRWEKVWNQRNQDSSVCDTREKLAIVPLMLNIIFS